MICGSKKDRGSRTSPFPLSACPSRWASNGRSPRRATFGFSRPLRDAGYWLCCSVTLRAADRRPDLIKVDAMMWLSRLFLLAALALVSLGGYQVLKPSVEPADETVSIDLADRELGRLPLGQHEIVFHITNPSDRPRRIIGFSGTCVVNCCFSSSHSSPVEILPRGNFPYTTELSIQAPGSFEVTVRLFVEDNGLQELPLTIRGIGVARENNVDGQFPGSQP